MPAELKFVCNTDIENFLSNQFNIKNKTQGVIKLSKIAECRPTPLLAILVVVQHIHCCTAYAP